MTMISRSFITGLIFTSALCTMSIGCSDDDGNDKDITPEVYREIAPLNVAMEVPPPTGTTNASGIFAFDLVEKTGELKYTLKVADLTGPAAAGHIHKGAVGVAGPVVVALMVPTTTVEVAGTVTLPPAAIADLKAGLLYVNIHTAANPGGEIRGQLKGALKTP